MKRLLLTGFGPFLTNETNPTELIVTKLNQEVIGSYEIHSFVLPVVFGEAGSEIIEAIKSNTYDAVIMLGLAANRKEITPERIAINCRDGKKDNANNSYVGARILESGPDGIFSTLPLQQLVEKLKEMNISASISNSAGTYVCNDTMYLVNLFLKEQEVRIPSGFIHVPPAQTEDEWNQLVKGIRLCVEVLDEG